MKTLQEKIAVMQAFADGKKIEARLGQNDWSHCPEPVWAWYDVDYRVKHEPVVVEKEYAICTDRGVVWADPRLPGLMQVGRIKIRLEDGKLVSVEIVK